MTRSSDPDTGPLRVCILTEANPLIWIHHYVNAFRATCDVVTAGPKLTASSLEKMGKSHLSHLLYANDIDIHIDNVEQLEQALPPGWHPHIVVGIQSGMGVPHGLPRLNRPTAYISVDTWHSVLDFSYALLHDFVFVAQREFVPLLQAAGSRHVQWLPLACSPEAHRPVPAEKDLDIAFVGSCGRAVHEQRRNRIKRLAAEFKLDFDDGLDAHDMCRMLARARLVFNSSIAGDVNMRVFEALAMGATLLTDRDAARNGLLDLFHDGEHLIAYDDANLLDLARRYLNDPESRARIGRAGRDRVLSRDTYAHRVQTILDTIQGMVPNLRELSGPILRESGTLRDQLPLAPEILVDAGLGLGVSKLGLRKLGAKRCIGVTSDKNEAQRRSGSYDETILLLDGDRAPALNADALILASPATLRSADEPPLTAANRMLRAGGALVACVDLRDAKACGIDPTVDGCARWVEAHGFVFLAVDTLASGPAGLPALAITARKRTMTVREACATVYAKHPLPNVTFDELMALIPERL